MSDDGRQETDADARSTDRPTLTVFNERIKYTATFLNTLAAGAIVAGFVAPLSALIFGDRPPTWPEALGTVWILVGVTLHLMVWRLLGRLKEPDQ